MPHCHDHTHPDYSKEIKRVNRIKGQVEGVGKMIEEQRYCPDILNQLKAIRSATRSLETQILKSHLNSCVKNAFQSKNKKDQEIKIKELTDLFYKYD